MFKGKSLKKYIIFDVSLTSILAAVTILALLSELVTTYGNIKGKIQTQNN